MSRADKRHHDALLQEARNMQKAETTIKSAIAEIFRPNAGWFLAGAGLIAGYIIGELHAPLWLAVLTFFVFLALAAVWPWVERHRKWRFAFWGFIVGYFLVAAICTAKLRDDAAIRLEKKVDRLQESQDQGLLGQRYSSEALSSRYPTGYVIFSLSYDNRIVFYKGRSATGNYAFDWERVKYLSNTPQTFEVQMPDIQEKGGPFQAHGNSLGGNKEVGWYMTFYTDGAISVVCEVIDADEKGIVFVIGLMQGVDRRGIILH